MQNSSCLKARLLELHPPSLLMICSRYPPGSWEGRTKHLRHRARELPYLCSMQKQDLIAPLQERIRRSGLTELPAVAVLVSGGVDSSVVVHLLTEAGYRPTLFYIQIGMEEKGFTDCSWRMIWRSCAIWHTAMTALSRSSRYTTSIGRTSSSTPSTPCAVVSPPTPI